MKRSRPLRPSLLLNGLYLLRLSAEDVFDRVAVDETTVAADGSMKVGHFALAFEDLTVPLSGIPIPGRPQLRQPRYQVRRLRDGLDLGGQRCPRANQRRAGCRLVPGASSA